MLSSSTQRKSQKGNVLFLILIAVALFAALSYAVTQSSRSGGDSSKETTSINTAQLTQYPNQVKTAATRLMINGNTPLDLYFNKPNNFTETFFATGNNAAQGVFHPTGGGAVYQKVPAAVVVGNTEVDWAFTADYKIRNVGTTPASGDISGNDLVMFAGPIKTDVCNKVNQQLHGASATTPTASAALTIQNDRDTASGAKPAAPNDSGFILASDANWDGRAFGCIYATGSTTVGGTAVAAGDGILFYVLAER